MKSKFYIFKNIAIVIFAIVLCSCEGRRDFPQLLESGVDIENKDILLITGETADIVPRFQPNIDPQREYLWEINNPDIADIETNSDQSVSVTAKSSGETEVTITSQDNEGLTASAFLKVIASNPVDITAMGSISVNNENGGGPNAGEGSPKLVDGDLGTKYLASYSTPFWATLEFDDAVIAGYYALTSGNDAPSRDPRDWEIQGSNDGTNWDTLDSRSDELFRERNLTREFYFNNNTAYKYYRFDILANNGDGLFQMSEWALFTLPD
ncbi:discoidin domain-containing protein [Flavivirga sp. 57AJ16]|uniref:discoidin domain-containing protein n=1 Tax=Flavivirga sp. 57AJ16 TaxID=3025307 RepID=UPI002366055A|nr:discoidin domain-containing protein [Flavivirga sp. 57AJ16]MDD7887566.1 discoidin domain-containing protein [Flavivirga sp. 57AJ16]